MADLRQEHALFRECQELSSNLYAFVKAAWPLVVKNAPFVDGWHIRAICDHLELVSHGIIRKLLINVPPRHSKSLIVSVFWPAWEWTWKPSTQWLFCSRVQKIALRDNRRCRELVESNWYQERWPIRMASDQNAKTFYVNANGGSREATSSGSKIVGADADRLVTDDLHDIDDTEDSCRDNVEWYTDSWTSRENDPMASTQVVIGQRVHAADISGWIQKNEADAWTILIFPLCFVPARACSTEFKTRHFPEGFKDPRTEPDERLWPARYDEATVEQRKQKPGRFARLDQQNPTPAEGGSFKRAWLTNRFRRLVASDVRLFLTSCDTPFKKGANTDFFVLGLLAKVGPSYYIIDLVRGRMSFDEMLSTYVDFITKWRNLGLPIMRHLMEAKASGDAIMATAGKTIAGIIPFNPGRDSKEQRYDAVSPIFSSMHVWFPAADAVLVIGERTVELNPFWVMDCVEELATVPKADHDDQADMITQAILDCEANTYVEPAGDFAEPEEDVYTVHRHGRQRGGFWSGQR